MPGLKTLGDSFDRLSGQVGALVDSVGRIDQAITGLGDKVAHMTILLTEMMQATDGAKSNLAALEQQMGATGEAAARLFASNANAENFAASLIDAFQSGAMSLLQFRLAAQQAEQQLEKLAGGATVAASKAAQLRALAQALRDVTAAAESAPPIPNAATGGFTL